MARSALISHEGAPPDPTVRVRQSLSADDVASIGRFLRDRSSSFSAAIAHCISSLASDDDDHHSDFRSRAPVTEFHLSSVKVIVRIKDAVDDDDTADESDGGDRPAPMPFSIKGRINFFSRSGSRDCGMVHAREGPHRQAEVEEEKEEEEDEG